MRPKQLVMSLMFALTAFSACKKDVDTEGECSSTTPTERSIIDKQATVRLTNGKYYIIEDGTFDTRLIPCSLSQNFQVNNLRVVISGEVKKTTQNRGEPCCSNFLVITSIM